MTTSAKIATTKRKMNSQRLSSPAMPSPSVNSGTALRPKAIAKKVRSSVGWDMAPTSENTVAAGQPLLCLRIPVKPGGPTPAEPRWSHATISGGLIARSSKWPKAHALAQMMIATPKMSAR